MVNSHPEGRVSFGEQNMIHAPTSSPLRCRERDPPSDDVAAFASYIYIVGYSARVIYDTAFFVLDVYYMLCTAYIDTQPRHLL